MSDGHRWPDTSARLERTKPLVADGMPRVHNVIPIEPLDGGGVDYRIGLIALGTSETTERDFRRVLPDSVAFHTTRIRDVNPVTIETLKSMGPDLTAAAKDLLPGVPLNAIAYDCTTGAIALGADTVRDQIQTGRPGVPVATPATAGVEALRLLDVTKLGVLIPNIDAVAQMLGEYFVAEGFNVVTLHNFNIDNDIAMARISPTSIMHAAREIAATDVDGVFISCTALRSVEIIEELEQSLGKPVVASNQAMLWQALRLAGFEHPIEGFGRLLFEH